MQTAKANRRKGKDGKRMAIIVYCNKLVDTDTGEILEDVTGLSYEQIGRMIWKKYRAMFEARKAFGKDKDNNTGWHYTYTANNLNGTRRRQSDIDFTPFDDDEFRTWKQNKAIVRAQLNAEAARIKAKKAAALIPPSDVAKRTANWWHKIIQDSYMRRGVLRHKNGKVLTKQAMAKILGCGVRNIEIILKELIEKGYMVRETNGGNGGDGTYYRMTLAL